MCLQCISTSAVKQEVLSRHSKSAVRAARRTKLPARRYRTAAPATCYMTSPARCAIRGSASSPALGPAVLQTISQGPARTLPARQLAMSHRRARQRLPTSTAKNNIMPCTILSRSLVTRGRPARLHWGAPEILATYSWHLCKHAW